MHTLALVSATLHAAVLGSFWTYQDEAGDELARQQRVLTMPSTALVEWPDELDGETDAPCEWYNGTYVHEPSLCSHFAVQRLRAETVQRATQRALQCAAQWATDCVLSVEIGFGVPAAFVYDAHEGVRMIVAPRPLPLARLHHARHLEREFAVGVRAHPVAPVVAGAARRAEPGALGGEGGEGGDRERRRRGRGARGLRERARDPRERAAHQASCAVVEEADPRKLQPAVGVFAAVGGGGVVRAAVRAVPPAPGSAGGGPHGPGAAPSARQGRWPPPLRVAARRSRSPRRSARSLRPVVAVVRR